MKEHRFNHEDRLQQLAELEHALEQLVLHLQQIGQFSHQIVLYEDALKEAQRLKTSGFGEAEILKLGRTVPDLFSRHRDWIPPLEQVGDDEWVEAPWYVELEIYLQPVLTIAQTLRTLGHY